MLGQYPNYDVHVDLDLLPLASLYIVIFISLAHKESDGNT